MNKSKLIKLMMVSSIVLTQVGGIAQVQAKEKAVEPITEQTQRENKEITEIKAVRNYEKYTLNYGTSFKDVNYDSLYSFVDQDGEEIPKELLNIEMFFEDWSNNVFGSIEEYHFDAFSELNDSAIKYYITARATLKENREVRSEKTQYSQSVRLITENSKPQGELKSEISYYFEGDSYNPNKNIEFFDFEDNRDNLELTVEHNMPAEMNKDNLEAGRYTVIHKAIDSKGEEVSLTETVIVKTRNFPLREAKSTFKIETGGIRLYFKDSMENREPKAFFKHNGADVYKMGTSNKGTIVELQADLPDVVMEDFRGLNEGWQVNISYTPFANIQDPENIVKNAELTIDTETVEQEGITGYTSIHTGDNAEKVLYKAEKGAGRGENVFDKENQKMKLIFDETDLELKGNQEASYISTATISIAGNVEP